MISLLLSMALSQNVLLCTIDDVAYDSIGYPNVYAQAPPTPNLDACANAGLRLTNFYAGPACSNTRGSIMTGLYPSGHGLVKPINRGSSSHWLSPGFYTLAEVMKDAGHSTAFLGKWHLGPDVPILGPAHPIASGFDIYAGCLVLPDVTYYDWTKSASNSNGLNVQFNENTYNTTDNTDDALFLIPVLEEPWFLWVSYFAPHWAPTREEYQEPPAGLSTVPWDPNDFWEQHRATMSALDTEFGRLMAGVDLTDTTVVVVGDNGTEKERTGSPQFGLWVADESKATPYEGGVKVPAFIRSDNILPAQDNSLLTANDLYGLIPDIADDGAFTLPWHDIVGAHYASPMVPPWTLDRKMATDGELKLISYEGTETVHDLTANPPFDGPRILPTPAQQPQVAALRAWMAANL